MAEKRGELRASVSIVLGELHDADLEVWRLHERNHDAVQPYIANHIIEEIHHNPTKSYKKIAEETGSSCSCSTIHSWLAGHVTYCNLEEWEEGMQVEREEVRVANVVDIERGVAAATEERD